MSSLPAGGNGLQMIAGNGAPGSLRYFSAAEMEVLTPPPERSLELAAQALRWLAAGEIEAPAKTSVHPHGHSLYAMPAFCGPLDVAAIKWIADFPLNTARGLPTISAVLVLSDGQTGIPYAIMDAAWLTGIRTAAMTGVSLAACSSGVQTLAIIGTGLEARTHLAMLPIALPSLKRIRVAGRTREAAEKFAASNRVNSARLQLEVADSVTEAVHGAEAVVTVTNQLEYQLIEPKELAVGATVVFVDNPGKEAATLHTADRIIVDDRAPFEHADVRRRFRHGPPRIDAVIGHVLNGDERGRTEPDQLVVIANLGNAALDIVFADDFYKRAHRAKDKIFGT